MNITYRKLTENDLETFISMRVAQLREEGATEELDLKPTLMDYYHRHMADGTFVSWLAMDGEMIIGTSGMSFAESRRTSCALRGELVSCPACIPEILWSIVFNYEYKEDY